MPIQSIFPNYAGGENRVTLAMLAVCERISIQLLEQIFRYATEDDTFSLVRFTAQPPLEGTKRRPDGEIAASCRYLFEVKRVPGALDQEQLEEYLRHLAPEGSNRLFAVTPDPVRPTVVDAIVDERLVWFNFARLSDAIERTIADEGERIPDRDRFLLRELQAHFEEAGLLRLGQDVAIVAAREAYPLYLTHYVYACQPASKRTFRPEIARIGFYANGAIQREVPRILRHEGEFELTDETFARCAASTDIHEQALGDAMQAMMEDKPGWYYEGTKQQVFLLASPDDADTRLLEQPVLNTTKDASGRAFAYTLGTRYTSSTVLEKQPKNTDELVTFSA
jgi:hypothetical protein